MKAYLVILDHPFASISNVDGEISTAGLPANTDLVFKVFHEAGRMHQVEIDNVPTVWNRSRFQLNLAPGLNDLGDILVPGDSLRN